MDERYPQVVGNILEGMYMDVRTGFMLLQNLHFHHPWWYILEMHADKDIGGRAMTGSYCRGCIFDLRMSQTHG